MIVTIFALAGLMHSLAFLPQLLVIRSPVRFLRHNVPSYFPLTWSYIPQFVSSSRSSSTTILHINCDSTPSYGEPRIVLVTMESLYLSTPLFACFLTSCPSRGVCFPLRCKLHCLVSRYAIYCRMLLWYPGRHPSANAG